MSAPFISVVVTTFQRDGLLCETLQSLADQTVPVDEVVVVDDGGPGTAAELVRQFGHRFRYHHKPNTGQQDSRNVGIGLARGDWICHLDDDDLWMPQRHAALRAAIQSGGEKVDAWFANAWRFVGDENLEATLFEEFEQRSPGYFSPLRPGNFDHAAWPQFPLLRLFPTGPFWPSMMAYRRSVLQRMGGWNVALKGVKSEDLEFCFRLCSTSEVGLIWEPTVRYRCHPGNDSASEYQVNLGRASVWQHVLDHVGMAPDVHQALTHALAELHRNLIWQASRQGDHAQVVASYRQLPRGSEGAANTIRYLRAWLSGGFASRAPRPLGAQGR